MPRNKKYTKEYLEEIVKDCLSVSEVVRRCGGTPSGGMHRLIKSHIETYKIDISHFTGKAWNKGKTFLPKIQDDNLFVQNSTTRGPTIRKRFLSNSLYVCEVCKNAGSWNNKKLTLHLDHINGDSTDNRKENLRWLCPNCHQQTETWGNTKIVVKKIKRSFSGPRENKRKINRPEKEQLKQMVDENGYEKTGRILGVSGSAIRKWLKMYDKWEQNKLLL